jgi:hypothetical protein
MTTGTIVGTEMDPMKLMIWAGIERVIKSGQMAGLLELARAISNALPGTELEEKLANLELGPENRETVILADLPGRLVRLHRDIFGQVDCCTLPWSRLTFDLLRRYNTSMPRGGGALHPLMIVQHEVHRYLGNIVDLASRNNLTGEVAVSQDGLRRLGLTVDQVHELLADGAALYYVAD